MRILKTHPILGLVNSYMVDSPQPSNISYMWNLGSLLGACLIIQIITGITLAMHYVPSIDLAFVSVEHIMRDVNFGWLIRYLHGAPWDGYFEQTELVERIFCLISVLICQQITTYSGKQSIQIIRWAACPVRSNKIGILYGEDNELDTSSRVQYALSVLSLISRLEHNIKSVVRVTLNLFYIIVRRSNKIVIWSKHLSSVVFKISKPRELIAYVHGIATTNTRGRSRRSNVSSLDSKINANYMKDDSLRELTTTLKALKYINVVKGPKPPKKDRANTSVFSWIKEKLEECRTKDDRYNGLIHIISDVNYLVVCYNLIKGKAGNMTPGSSQETLDKIDLRYFETISSLLKSGKYTFTPNRRIMIPKDGKRGLRSLSIGSPRDKIVQKAVALVLEAVYEPQFTPDSHGFRPNKGVHSALYELYSKGGNYSWVINGDISKCFDTIPHNTTLNLLKSKIICHRTLELIGKSLMNPSIEFSDNNREKIIPNFTGTPQGSILSPVLSNIILHQLDLFMEKHKEKFEVGRVRKVNPKYHSLSNVRFKTRKELKARNLILMKNMSPHDPIDPKFKRMLYVRYADDFVVLLISSLSEAYQWRRKIKDFLHNHLGLTLNVGKTSISNLKKGFDFLGAFIEKKGQVIRKVKGTAGIRRRFSRRLYITAPLVKIISKLKVNKFTKTNHLGSIIATGRKDLVNHTHYDILRFYNSRIRGILYFYSFASNYSHLRRVVWLLHQSCALTLTLKYKLKTIRAVMTKYGKDLTCPLTGIKLYTEKVMKVKHDFKNKRSSINLDELLKGSWY